MSQYDSREDTMKHINRVRTLLRTATSELEKRAVSHDRSKLEEPEKAYFDRLTPLLAGLTYGSAEYKSILAELEPALKHHYASNSHHPEHYQNGIDGMNLFDLIEMFLDWKAASERHNDGSISRSIIINTGRFNLSPQLAHILENTVTSLGWEK